MEAVVGVKVEVADVNLDALAVRNLVDPDLGLDQDRDAVVRRVAPDAPDPVDPDPAVPDPTDPNPGR